MPQNWAEVQQVQDEKRCELVLSGSQYSERILKDGLDPAIFKLTHLNFLEISKTCLKELPADIGELENLSRMVICYNNLSTVPPEIAKLKKLKFFDVSHNAISQLPTELSELTELLSINVSSNKLTALPDVGNMSKLVTINISCNEFSSLPSSIYDSKLIRFTDLIANNNKINTIPSSIEMLNSLKVLDLAENELKCVPGELGDCSKLKELNLKGNKLEDKRLRKLVDQCHAKQVIDYIRNHCPKSDKNADKQNKSKKKGKPNKKGEIEQVIESIDELKINHCDDDSRKVICSSKVSEIRPYIVCCKVLNVDITDSSLLKKFITLQTKLHDTLCEKRTIATIATHDFDKIGGNLLYDAKSPEEILITPLNKKGEVTAANLYAQMNEEADAIRKEKKKNAYSGIHKYLYLLKDKPLYPCLIDTSNNRVISFPPITNCEETKISSETNTMFLEVTGSNLNTCKKIMDNLVTEMLKLGIGKKVSEEEAENETSKNVLAVEQVKVVDEEGKLKVVYPSRTDISTEGITVIRS